MSKTILVVDDAAFMRMMIRDILIKDGYVIHEAVNGRDAVEKYQESRPDLVTLDVTMPEMDGIEALAALRAVDPDARVLMVSAMGQQALIMAALEAGATDFLIKPFQPSKVLETVRRCIEPGER
jgi:two-component system, chemotaxis family, chemotaxis protein CheY